ncbi:MAG TPA: hypothetical protein PKW17_13880 [Smithellaceae bacterium]|nr:hypothetical protein [Smithellaceae bacterium]
MENALQVIEPNQDVAILRPPEIVLAEAQKAARALADIVSKKKRPVIMNGEQYLEFEDWQTVGRFYGVTAKITTTDFIDLGGVHGFMARAVALRADGMEISAAEAMCLNDEKNWKDKPLFQLRSMAQTRACAKALRNVLAWVVVLAGYKPTPAEEMQEVFNGKPPVAEPQRKPAMKDPDSPATEAQIKCIQTIFGKLKVTDEFEKHQKASQLAGIPEPQVITSLSNLTKAQAGKVIEGLSAEGVK